MNKEADSPASAQQKDTPMGRHPLASLWFDLLLAEEKVCAKKKHSFCFLCLLPKHHRIQSRQIRFPTNLHSPLLTLFFQTVTSSRMSAQISDHTRSLQAQGSSRLDCTHSKDNTIALPAFCVPVPSPRRSSGIKMARFQFPFWHMLVPESLTMPSVQECGMVGVKSTIQTAQ